MSLKGAAGAWLARVETIGTRHVSARTLRTKDFPVM
jgi:hypothetical protein